MSTKYWSISGNFRALYAHDGDTFHLINGLRFFSFIWILVFHTLYIYGLKHTKEEFFTITDEAPFYLWWIWNADKAVDLFFVISGFLIGVILFKEIAKTGDIKLKRFYFRRYLRLTPLYAVILLLYWLAEAPNHEWVWTNLFYLNNFLPMEKMAMQWTWTLAVEEQFYLLLPLLLLFIHRLSGQPFIRILFSLLILSFLIRFGVLYYYDEMWNASYRELLIDDVVHRFFYPKLYDNLITRYGPFVCGVMASYAYCYHNKALYSWLTATRYRSLIVNVFALFVVAFFAFFPILQSAYEQPSAGLKMYLIFHRTLFSAGVAWFMLAVFLNLNQFTLLAKFFSLKIWQPFSQLTYSMYLFHFMVILALIKTIELNLQTIGLSGGALVWSTIFVTAIVSLLVTIVIGVLCWLLIEKPFLNMRELFEVNRGATSSAPIHHSSPVKTNVENAETKSKQVTENPALKV